MADEPTASRQEKPTAVAPKFDFYNLLPEVEINSPARKGKTAPVTKNHQTNVDIMLQTGAFTLLKDADRRKAELLLLGLDVNIETVEVKGQTFHRVHVGPFNSNRTLSQAKEMLKQNGIEHLQRTN